MRMSSNYKPSIPVNVPLNFVDHVNIDNMGFVLTLRSSTPVSNKAKQKVKGPEVSSHHQPIVSKSGSCTNPLCIGDFDAIQREILEREDLLRQLKFLQVDLEDEEITRIAVEQEYHKVLQSQESLQQRLSTLDVDYFRLKDKLSSALEEQKKLGEQISIANATIRNEKEKIANMKKKKMAETNKKHNGVFTMQQTGVYMWSCCLSNDPNGGCIDEHSVGIRSHLIHAPRPPRPTAILPPSGHILSSSLHNKSTYSLPKYAFWSTRKDENGGVDGGGSRVPVYLPSFNPSVSIAMSQPFHSRPQTASLAHSHSRSRQGESRGGSKGDSVISSDTPSQTLPNLSASSPGGRRGSFQPQVSFYRSGEDTEDARVTTGQSKIGAGMGMGGLGNSFLMSTSFKGTGEKNVGSVRVDYQSVLKKVNRPMSSPSAYSAFGQML